MNFMIGQRVIVGNEIGRVVPPEHRNMDGVWVFLESRGYASCYAEWNVKPLPGGQL
jgi:hypothetical protein